MPVLSEAIIYKQKVVSAMLTHRDGTPGLLAPVLSTNACQAGVVEPAQLQEAQTEMLQIFGMGLTKFSRRFLKSCHLLTTSLQSCVVLFLFKFKHSFLSLKSYNLSLTDGTFRSF